MMSRDEIVTEVHKHLENKNLRKHILAVEAVMRKLAEHFGQDGDRWGAAGLLHDVDYEQTKDDWTKHSQLSADMVEELGFDKEIVDAVRTHNEMHHLPRETMMAKSLYCADPLTGLIVAAALVSPDKKISAIDGDFVMKRFGEKAFARGANRDTIRSCSEIGMELKDFIDLGVKAMQGISKELGL